MFEKLAGTNKAIMVFTKLELQDRITALTEREARLTKMIPEAMNAGNKAKMQEMLAKVQAMKASAETVLPSL